MVKDVEKYYSQLALSVFLLTTISSKKSPSHQTYFGYILIVEIWICEVLKKEFDWIVEINY